MDGTLRDWKTTWTRVNFSPMSPRLLLTYPHREEERGIDLAPLFLRLVLLKLLSNQLKICVNLTFSQKVWPFSLFWFTLCWAESAVSLLCQKCQIFKVYYLWSKKFDTKINAIIVISELMASVGKVLRHFCRSGEKFTRGGWGSRDKGEIVFKISIFVHLRGRAGQNWVTIWST